MMRATREATNRPPNIARKSPVDSTLTSMKGPISAVLASKVVKIGGGTTGVSNMVACREAGRDEKGSGI